MPTCWTCGRDTKTSTIACWSCKLKKTLLSVSAWRNLILGVALVAGVGLAAYRMRPDWFRFGGRGAQDNATQQESDYEVRLHAESTVVPIAVDLVTCDELNTIASAKYGFGYPRLLREERVVDIPGNSLAVVLAEEKSRVKLRVTLPTRTVVGWVPLGWLRPRDPDLSSSMREQADGGLP